MFVQGMTPAAGAYDYPLIIRHLLRTPLTHHPGQEIVYSDKRRYSYSQFNLRISALAHGLQKLGVKQGKTVAVLDWDSHRYLECFFAVPMLGAVLHTVNIRLSPEQILYTINHAEDNFILIHEDFLGIIESLRDRIQTRCQFILLSDSNASITTTLDIKDGYETVIERGDADFEFKDFDENTQATTFYTTGTTGNPKGVYYSHRQLVLHTLAVAASMSISAGHGTFSSDDVYMPITPMFHVHAWGFPYIATLFGAKQVYPGKYLPDRLLGLIAKENVTFSHCVPTILHMLLQAQTSLKTDLSSWKVVIGGAALPPSLAARAMALGIDIFGGYGLSETCPILTLAKLDNADLAQNQEDQLNLRCKAGRAVAMVDIKTVDEKFKEIPMDGESTGEVVVRSPWLAQGYLKETKRSDELWQSGYLHTGDIGHIDKNGYLKVTDRLKDVIKTGGEWISSLQLEDIVTELDQVSEACAFGVEDEKWGERPIVLVVLIAQAQLSENDIKAHIKRQSDAGVISKWALPDRVYFVEGIAKTSVGKHDKKLLRTQYS